MRYWSRKSGRRSRFANSEQPPFRWPGRRGFRPRPLSGSKAHGDRGSRRGPCRFRTGFPKAGRFAPTRRGSPPPSPVAPVSRRPCLPSGSPPVLIAPSPPAPSSRAARTVLSPPRGRSGAALAPVDARPGARPRRPADLFPRPGPVQVAPKPEPAPRPRTGPEPRHAPRDRRRLHRRLGADRELHPRLRAGGGRTSTRSPPPSSCGSRPPAPPTCQMTPRPACAGSPDAAGPRRARSSSAPRRTAPSPATARTPANAWPS